MSFELLFVLSIAAGAIGAMTGLGGGGVLIPVLTMSGVDIKQAIAVSILSVIATSSGAASAYVRDRITNLKVGMFLEMFTILGALAGASITLVSGQRVLFFIFGGVLLAIGAIVWKERKRGWKIAENQDKFSRWLELDGSYYDKSEGKTIPYRGVRAYFGAPLMFVAGVVAGLLGIGAGALKVLIFDVVMGFPPKVSTTTSNLIIGVTALAGASVYLAAGMVDAGLAVPVILGITIGAFLGTRFLVRVSNKTVQTVFLFVLVALGVEMIWRGFRGE